MMGLSRDDFEEYCNAIDAALASCSTESQRAMISELAMVMLNGSTISVRRSARSAIADIMCGLYSRSANLQASVVDEFCMKHFGAEPSAISFSIPKSQALEEIGYLAERFIETGDSSEFASRACSWASVKSQECANMKMEANCGKKYGRRRVKYAYVPRSGKVCGFCCMMASRDFDFTSSAKQKLHDNCLCKLMPETAKPIEGYDSKTYKDGFDLLYEGKDDSGRPVFKSGMLFDCETGEVVQREAESSRERREATLKPRRAKENEMKYGIPLKTDEAKTAITSKWFFNELGSDNAFDVAQMIDDAIASGDKNRALAAKIFVNRLSGDSPFNAAYDGKRSFFDPLTGMITFKNHRIEGDTAIHEIAHLIDFKVSIPFGKSSSTSGSFSSFLFSSRSGDSLRSMMKIADNGETQSWTELKRRIGASSDDEAEEILESLIGDRLQGVKSRLLSDMIHGASNGKVDLGFGHYDESGNSYWDNRTRVLELWADYFSTLIMRPDELALISELFPTETSIMNEMLEVIADEI